MAEVSLGSRMAGKQGWGRYFQFDRNVYILLFLTLGKGFQLSIGALTINLYVHSLGYRNDQVGIVAAANALGALIAAVPVGMLADRLGRKPLLIHRRHPDAGDAGVPGAEHEPAAADPGESGQRHHRVGLLGDESADDHGKHDG